MRRAQLSIVLIGIALLAACAAGPGSREAVQEGVEAPSTMRSSRAPASAPGAQIGSGASVTYEVGDGRAAERVTDQARLWGGGDRGEAPADWPSSSGFEAGVLYAMAYFPSPSGVETERANRLGELYGDARPGYGLYTFILGGPVGASSTADADAYSEFLRVIETYVMNNPEGASDSEGRHGFLIQVDAAKPPDEASLDLELIDRARPGLSLQIQSILARQLRMFGQVELADRLEHSDGPFLVTSLQPSLIPRSGPMPLLIVDLHDLGPEYMYSLVDAYDRPIPPDLLGRPGSLSAIGRRIQAMFPNRRVDSGAAPPPSGEWIWLIGAPGRGDTLAAISEES